MHAKKTKQRGITADSIKKVTEVSPNLKSSRWNRLMCGIEESHEVQVLKAVPMMTLVLW